MKRTLLSVSIFLFTSTALLMGQGMDFFHGSIEEAFKEAKKDNKLIFVDAYTSWCGPCRRMQNKIFPQKEVGDFYNKNFINMKINMETQEGMKFGLDFPVHAYPTLMFISPEKKLVIKSVGGKNIEDFLKLGQKALRSYDKSEDLEEEWNNGNRDYQFVLKYVKALRNAEKPTNKVALEYIRSNPKISDDEKAVLIYEATSECDSKLFELMTEKKNFNVIKDIYAEEEWSDKIYASCSRTVDKSFEYDVEELKEEAIKKMKKYCGERYKEFRTKISLIESKKSNNLDKYAKESKKYFKLIKDSKKRMEFIEEICGDFPSEKNIMDLAEELAEKTYKDDKTAANYTYWIKHLLSNKKYDTAREHMAKALRLAKEQKDQVSQNKIKRYEFYLQKR